MRYTVNVTARGALIRVFGVTHTTHSTLKLARHLQSWCTELIRATYYERERPSVSQLIEAAGTRIESL